MRDPEPAEIAAFAAICALVLFAPTTPLVEQFAREASERGMSMGQAQAMLMAIAFAGLSALALAVDLLSAALARLRRDF